MIRASVPERVGTLLSGALQLRETSVAESHEKASAVQLRDRLRASVAKVAGANLAGELVSADADSVLLAFGAAVTRTHWRVVGGPITPTSVAQAVWTRRHAFVSFEHPCQVSLAAEVCQSFALDNGAFSKWKKGGSVDVPAYVAWVKEWEKHPGFDWALIPDVIDGTEAENDFMFAKYHAAGGEVLKGVPIWHLHEPYERLARLCRGWQRVALGSSGEWSEVGTAGWWQRMGGAMDFICDDEGRPPCKLHGLRMLSPTIFSQLPLASADSTMVARNHALDKAWKGPYQPLSQNVRAQVLVDRIEHHASAARWTRSFGHQHNLDLVG